MINVLLILDGRHFDARQTAWRANFDLLWRLQYHVHLSVYGDMEHLIDPDKYLVKMVFNPKAQMDDVIAEHKPDVILCWTYTQCWPSLPHQFAQCRNIPKAIVEVDYYAVPDKNFYKNMGFDVIIQRGFYQQFESAVPLVWLPFSVRNSDFDRAGAVAFQNRQSYITFVGNGIRGPGSKNAYYTLRRRAVTELSSAGILRNVGFVGNNGYVHRISTYKGAVTCTAGSRHAPISKVFEIMGYGTGLLCPWFNGREILFGKMTESTPYCSIYEDDCSNLVSNAQKIINDDAYTKDMTTRARKIIEDRHLHSHRIRELVNILEALVEHKEVPQVWGQ